MKNLTFLLLLLAVVACTSQNQDPIAEPAEPHFFVGSWALDLDYESSNVGWLEIRQEENYLDADLLWRWGSVGPMEFVFFTDNHLLATNSWEIVREEDADGNTLRKQRITNWWTVVKTGANEISGYATFPSTDGIEVEHVAYTGKRIPDAGAPPDLTKVVFNEPEALLAENSLDGWELLESGATNGWKVIDGVLINDPVQPESGEHIHYGNLRTTDTFEDFNLTLEVNVPEGSNSGIYLKGIYEIQVFDSYGKDLDSHNMGALYSRIAPLSAAEKPAGEWQELNITLVNRHVTVFLNGELIINNQPVKGVTGGAMTADEFIPGPIYLQGDHGEVRYRKIEISSVDR